MFEFLNNSVFLFSESSVNTIGELELMTEEEDTVMEAYEAVPCAEDNVDDAMMRIALENVENYHMIVEAIMMDEFNEYMTTNEEVIYEEGRIKKVTSAIKRFIENAWAKIKGVFDKVLTAIDTAVRSDKKFLEANREKIKNFKGNVDFKGYNYKNLDSNPYSSVIGAFTNTVGSIFKYIDKSNNIAKTGDDKSLKDAIENLSDSLRGAAVDKGTCTASDFTKELKMKFAGSSEKVDVSMSSDAVIKELETAKATKAKVKGAYNSVKSYFNNMIKSNNAMEKVAVNATSRKDVKESGVSAAIGLYNKACKDAITVCSQTVRVHLSAISASHRQTRAIASKMAGTKSESDSKSTNESALDLIQLV